MSQPHERRPLTRSELLGVLSRLAGYLDAADIAFSNDRNPHRQAEGNAACVAGRALLHRALAGDDPLSIERAAKRVGYLDDRETYLAWRNRGGA